MNRAQLDMFAVEEDAALAGPVVFRADPDEVRRKLDRILAEARAAAAMPWDRSKERYWRTVFPQMTRWLPDDEAVRRCAEFEAELARLLAG